MKLFRILINIRPLILVIALLVFHKASAQDRLWYIKGYRALLEARFTNPTAWYNDHESNLNSLLSVTLDKKNDMEILVPLISIQGADTTVLFCNTRLLRKHYRKENLTFRTTLDLSKACTSSLRLKELQLDVHYRYDSVFDAMRSNIVLNRELFDLNDFIDTPKTSLCCIPNNYNERLSHIYFFFVNGILLVEDRYNGGLHYLRY